MVKCEICKEKDSTGYQILYPLPITKEQEWRGVVPQGDKLVRICDDCKGLIFFNPETHEVLNTKG